MLILERHEIRASGLRNESQKGLMARIHTIHDVNKDSDDGNDRDAKRRTAAQSDAELEGMSRH